MTVVQLNGATRHPITVIPPTNLDLIYTRTTTKIEGLAKFFGMSRGTAVEGKEALKKILREADPHRMTDIVVKVRESSIFRRSKEYGGLLASFITRLSANSREQKVINLLKGSTQRVARRVVSQSGIGQTALTQPGDLVFIPVMEEKNVALWTGTDLKRSDDVLLGLFELFCELVANPARFEGATYVADGDEVSINGAVQVPSITINERNLIIIKLLPKGKLLKPLSRMTGFTVR